MSSKIKINQNGIVSEDGERLREHLICLVAQSIPLYLSYPRLLCEFLYQTLFLLFLKTQYPI